MLQFQARAAHQRRRDRRREEQPKAREHHRIIEATLLEDGAVDEDERGTDGEVEAARQQYAHVLHHAGPPRRLLLLR